MIGEIIKAVMDECGAYLQSQGQGGAVILKTNYKDHQPETYNMPLVLVDLMGAPGSMQLLGGLTQVNWQFAFSSYNLMPDPYNNDATSYSTDLLNVPLDGIRQHFSVGVQAGWLTQGMTDVLNNYGFRFMLSGIKPAEPLQGDNGQAMGSQLVFDSIAFDPATQGIVDSSSPLATVHAAGRSSAVTD